MRLRCCWAIVLFEAIQSSSCAFQFIAICTPQLRAHPLFLSSFFSSHGQQTLEFRFMRQSWHDCSARGDQRHPPRMRRLTYPAPVITDESPRPCLHSFESKHLVLRSLSLCANQKLSIDPSSKRTPLPDVKYYDVQKVAFKKPDFRDTWPTRNSASSTFRPSHSRRPLSLWSSCSRAVPDLIRHEVRGQPSTAASAVSLPATSSLQSLPSPRFIYGKSISAFPAISFSASAPPPPPALISQYGQSRAPVFSLALPHASFITSLRMNASWRAPLPLDIINERLFWPLMNGFEGRSDRWIIGLWRGTPIVEHALWAHWGRDGDRKGILGW